VTHTDALTPPLSTLPVRRPLVRFLRNAVSDSPSVLAHFALCAAPFVELSVWPFVLAVVLTPVLGLGITAGFHRCLAHRAFKTSRVLQFLLASVGCAALQKGPLWWVAYHRAHPPERRPARRPALTGRGRILVRALWLATRTRPHEPRPRHRAGLGEVPGLMWLDRLWMVPGALVAAACYALLGWSGVVLGYALAVVFRVSRHICDQFRRACVRTPPVRDC